MIPASTSRKCVLSLEFDRCLVIVVSLFVCVDFYCIVVRVLVFVVFVCSVDF